MGVKSHPDCPEGLTLHTLQSQVACEATAGNGQPDVARISRHRDKRFRESVSQQSRLKKVIQRRQQFLQLLCWFITNGNASVTRIELTFGYSIEKGQQKILMIGE